MKKILPLIFFIISGVNFAIAQNQDIKELYFDYTVVRMNGNQTQTTINKALTLLQRSSELTEKQIANVNFHLGRIYVATGAPEKAIPHYEEVIKLVPGYYVTHRALGLIYLKKCDSLGRIVSESAKAKNAALNEQSFKTYKMQVLKTIPYLEKSQACDADETTLGILTNLYKSIKDTTSLATLPTRLGELGKECITLLDDE